MLSVIRRCSVGLRPCVRQRTSTRSEDRVPTTVARWAAHRLRTVVMVDTGAPSRGGNQRQHIIVMREPDLDLVKPAGSSSKTIAR